jgi:hypothetical protein
MKSDRIALFAILSALALAPLAVAACATADLIAAPGVDAGPLGVVSESGTDAPVASDAGDAGDAGDAADAARDAGATDASDVSADAPQG